MSRVRATPTTAHAFISRVSSGPRLAGEATRPPDSGPGRHAVPCPSLRSPVPPQHGGPQPLNAALQAGVPHEAGPRLSLQTPCLFLAPLLPTLPQEGRDLRSPQPDSGQELGHCLLSEWTSLGPAPAAPSARCLLVGSSPFPGLALRTPTLFWSALPVLCLLLFPASFFFHGSTFFVPGCYYGMVRTFTANRTG